MTILSTNENIHILNGKKIFLTDDLVENKKCWKINFELGSLDQSFLNDLIQNKHFQSKNELAPIPKNLSHGEDKKLRAFGS